MFHNDYIYCHDTGETHIFNEIDNISLFQKWCITFTLMEEMRFFLYIL